MLSCCGPAAGLHPRGLGGEQGELCTSRYCLKQVCLQSQSFLGVQPFLLLQKPPEYSACRPGPLVVTRGSSVGNETPVWSACLGRAGAGREVEVPELVAGAAGEKPHPQRGRAGLGRGRPQPCCLHRPQMEAHANSNTVHIRTAWIWLSRGVTLSRSLSTSEPQSLSEKWGEACPLHKMLMKIKGADGPGSRPWRQQERLFLLHEQTWMNIPWQ